MYQKKILPTSKSVINGIRWMHCTVWCPCLFQIMPQLLNHLKVDTTDASIDWGTVAIYTCADSCDQDTKYSAEFIWKQDFSGDQAV